MTAQTYFAPAEKAAADELQIQKAHAESNDLVGALLNCFPGPAVILNRQRQIICANQNLAGLLDCSPVALFGMRIGEALHCVHCCEEPGGCGTTLFCRTCGAAKAMVHAIDLGTSDVQECGITSNSLSHQTAWDFRVWATPLKLGSQFTVFALQDIADEKRRMVLERMFFHDVLNAAGGLSGLLGCWDDFTPEKTSELASLARNLAVELVEEIESGRDLAAAERGELKSARNLVDVAGLLEKLCFLYRHHSVAQGKHLEYRISSDLSTMHTDGLLLRRVLGNLIKNALEHSNEGQSVVVSFDRMEEWPLFLVRSENVIPEEIQLQIFRRSFTTKPGSGHGVGTYSVKLLTERYLDGRVDFTSNTAQGTTFRVWLPQD